MKNKLIPVLLLSTAMLATTVSAASVKVSDGKSEFTVSQTTKANTEATLIVVKSGAGIADNDQIYAMEYTTSNSEGKAEWTVKMEEKRGEVLTDGEYDLYIKVPGEKLITDTMTYASLESRNGLLTALQAVKSSDDLKAIINDASMAVALKGSGFELDIYTDLATDKNGNINSSIEKAVADEAFSLTGSFASVTAEAVAESFNKSVATAGIKSDGKNAAKYLEISDLGYDGTKYSDITDAKLTSWLDDCLNGASVKTYAELEKAYQTANILYIINNTRVSSIETILGKYASALGLTSSSDYKSYTKLSSKNKADEKIVNTLKATPAKTVSALEDAIAAGVKAAGKSDSGSGGGSSSGGGGGGGSSSGGVFVGTNSTPVSAGATNVTDKRFSDLGEAEWAREAVLKMADKGIISGDGEGKFNPNTPMTREEFVKMLVEATGSFNVNATCGFADCPSDAWYYKYVASANGSGIVGGIGDNLFGVGQKLTRQDMAVLCRRAKGGSLTATKENVLFSDDAQISDYAKDAVYELYRAGVIGGMGDGSFAPRGTATRAQGAVMIYNLFVK